MSRTEFFGNSIFSPVGERGLTGKSALRTMPTAPPDAGGERWGSPISFEVRMTTFTRLTGGDAHHPI